MKRLEHSYGAEILKEIEIDGLPRDAGAAQALFDRNPFDFERWAVSFLNAQHEPTRGMIDAANHGGTYTHPANGQTASDHHHERPAGREAPCAAVDPAAVCAGTASAARYGRSGAVLR